MAVCVLYRLAVTVFYFLCYLVGKVTCSKYELKWRIFSDL